MLINCVFSTLLSPDGMSSTNKHVYRPLTETSTEMLILHEILKRMLSNFKEILNNVFLQRMNRTSRKTFCQSDDGVISLWLLQTTKT